MNRKQIIGAAGFLFIVLVATPALLSHYERNDLFYTMTSVWLLSTISGGVWLTFFIGRINIGQGAYALMGGYVSAVLVLKYGFSFWLSLPLSGLFCAVASVLIGLPILRLRGVYFAMVTLVMTEVARLLAQALPITNGSKGLTNIPPPGAVEIFGVTLIPDFASLANDKIGYYYLAAILMILSFAGLYRLVNSRLGFLCAAPCSKTRSSPPPSASTSSTCGSSPTPSPPSLAALAAPASPPSANPSTRAASPSKTPSTSCSTAFWAASTMSSAPSSAPSSSSSAGTSSSGPPNTSY